ncbi:uncharacterized protein LOC127102375 isoform X1 [Lathyrus oleraceus]|uniref:uncharacterized protein LOC127102375 isoform X1 n=1 Tax=Pisum sativum TaxID=3888 RepID=UPI0021D05A51|nr:uncharacterized protein LOC127102375 isoform X1 [Pisum sativum]
MENASSQSLSMSNDVLSGGPFIASTQSNTIGNKIAYMERLVNDLNSSARRENALHVLSKRTDLFNELAPLLWSSFGTIAILLQEILSIYPNLSPPTLSTAESTRVCNILGLLQCVATHSDTKMLFIEANMPLYLYPFLKTKDILPQFENLRLASLGVIGALVKVNTKEVIGFLLSSEIIPLCLNNIEVGTEITKTVATFIIQRILADEDGLAYVCATVERFFAVSRVLNLMLKNLQTQPSFRLLKIVVTCYSRLSDNRSRAGIALTTCLPSILTNGTFINCLREDPAAWRCVMQLYENMGVNEVRLVPGGETINDRVGSSSSGK